MTQEAGGVKIFSDDENSRCVKTQKVFHGFVVQPMTKWILAVNMEGRKKE